jgi:hypothetical protein
MTIFILNGSTMDMGFLSEGDVLFHPDGIFTHSFHSKFQIDPFIVLV